MLFRGLKKRGEVQTVAPVELVGHVLGGVLVFLVILVIIVFTILYVSQKDKEVAINNFIALATKIESLSRSRDQFDTQTGFPFFLPSGKSDYVVVGFNKEWKDYEKSDGCGDSEAVRKPGASDGKEGQKCQDTACICLFAYGSNYKFMAEYGKYNEYELIQCESLPRVNYIITQYLGTTTSGDAKTKGPAYGYPEEIWSNMDGEIIHEVSNYAGRNVRDYAFFYIYSQCDGWNWDVNLGSIKLYIEKFTNNKVNYMFIAPEGTNFINERYDAMYEKYRKYSIEEYREIISNFYEKGKERKALEDPTKEKEEGEQVLYYYQKLKKDYPEEQLPEDQLVFIAIAYYYQYFFSYTTPYSAYAETYANILQEYTDKHPVGTSLEPQESKLLYYLAISKFQIPYEEISATPKVISNDKKEKIYKAIEIYEELISKGDREDYYVLDAYNQVTRLHGYLCSSANLEECQKALDAIERSGKKWILIEEKVQAIIDSTSN